MHTNFHNFLRTRRSIRRFESTVPQTDVLERILETAMHAPSAHNRQPWRFIVITQPELKLRLGHFLAIDFRRDLLADALSEAEIELQLKRSKNRINDAPVVIILCMDTSEMDIYPDDKRAQAERTMAIQSVAAAGLQLQLAAHAEGLSSVWTCAPLFSPQTIGAALGTPKHWEPQAMFFMGLAAQEPTEKSLKALSEVVKFL